MAPALAMDGSRKGGLMLGREPREILAIFVGGAIGALARAGMAEWLAAPAGSWPWDTFVVNLVAALLLGYFTTRLVERLPASNYRRPFLGTGICGGLSTFSTMQVEVLHMIQTDAWTILVGYLTASIIGGLLAVHLGTALARRTGARL